MQNKSEGFLKPEKVLEQIDLETGMKMAEFGCGRGYFIIPMAKITGDKGRVYALDVQNIALETVRSRAALEGLANIETIRCNLELNGGSKFADDFLDLVLVANILFQTQKKSDMILEARRILKPKSQLIVIDWSENSAFAPKEAYLISKSQARTMIEDLGFDFKKEIEVDSQHFGLVFIKS